VQYVMEGSVQREGNRVRITVQLIDALTGRHLFSERYDRELKDILILQDEITMKVLTAVQVKLTGGEDARLRAKGTKNLDAYLKLAQAREHYQIVNKEEQSLARHLAEEAIALDPQYSAAYAFLANITFTEVFLGVYKNPREALERAIEQGKKAVALDGSSSHAHASLSFPYVLLREHEKALLEAEQAVSLEPNSAAAHHALGMVLMYSGRFEEAAAFFNKSLRLSPIPVSYNVLVLLGRTYDLLGRYEEAEATIKKLFRLSGPDHLTGHVVLVNVYVHMGREKEARGEAAEIMRIDPKFSVESYAKKMPWKDQKIIDDFVSTMRKAGLK
jgi:adenylate cyclase